MFILIFAVELCMLSFSAAHITVSGIQARSIPNNFITGLSTERSGFSDENRPKRHQ